MKKFLLTLVAVFGLAAANAQSINDSVGFINFSNDSQFDMSVGRTGWAISDGIDADGVGGWMLSTSYDIAEGGFKFAPELDVIFWDQGFGTAVMPGVEIGHNNIFAVASYDTQDEQFVIGVGGEINLGEALSLDISYQQGNTDLGYYGDFAVGYFQLALTYNF